jgi:hypothetical protein
MFFVLFFALLGWIGENLTNAGRFVDHNLCQSKF